MSDRLSVVFCNQCGSEAVDVNHWIDSGTCVFQCYECGNHGKVYGFTSGRAIADGTAFRVLEDAIGVVRKEALQDRAAFRIADAEDRIADAARCWASFVVLTRELAAALRRYGHPGSPPAPSVIKQLNEALNEHGLVVTEKGSKAGWKA